MPNSARATERHSHYYEGLGKGGIPADSHARPAGKYTLPAHRLLVSICGSWDVEQTKLSGEGHAASSQRSNIFPPSSAFRKDRPLCLRPQCG